MGGRGRGRGTGLSFNTELLGFSRGEALPAAAVSPPPLFPPLTNMPPPIVKTVEDEYLVTVQAELVAQFRGSPYYLTPGAACPPLRWERLPRELRPGGGKTASGRKKKKKLPKAAAGEAKKAKVDIAEKLKQLEQLDEKEKSDEDEGEADGEKEGDSDEEKKENKEDEDEEEEEDEEMDGGTDYANNYFDNGEDFEEDDNDNLDEGGIY